MKAALENITEWKLEAGEDQDLYFLQTNDYNLISSGEKSIVIGRKGTGKTAICEHIHNLKDNKRFSSLHSLKSFPFNELYTLKDENYSFTNQYITIWKYVILSAICRMMVDNRAIDYMERKNLSKIFDFSLEDAFAKRFKKITDRSFEFKIVGTGITAGSAVENENNTARFSRRVEFLEEYIARHIDDSDYFILFDSLDEDYNNILTIADHNKQYFELIKGLIKASQEIKIKFKRLNKNVFSTVFLRDDIYDLVKDNDKAKWIDSAVDLRWNKKDLQELFAYRISKAFDPKAEALDFSEAWALLFKEQRTRYGRRQSKSIDTFDYLAKCTYQRPRDMISYIRACTKISIERAENKVSNATIKEAEILHSDFILQELVSEIHSIVPEIQDIFDMFSQIRKQIMHRREFNDNYRELQKNLVGSKANLTETKLLEVLYHFSVIGNQTRGGHLIFKYLKPRIRFNRNERIAIHRSLYKSLQLH